MKQVQIGNLSFSKVICGSNPFYGHSHFSEARDTEYSSRFNDVAVEQVMMHCLDLGVNTLESCANERILSILNRLRRETSQPIHFIGSTRIDETSEIKSHQKKLSFLIDNKADVCVIHAQYVDRPRKGDSIGGLAQLIGKIHDAGLIAAISTHQIETVLLCERLNYGVDTYLFPLNLSGFVYPGYEGIETVQDRIKTVQEIPKPFILIKTLGAGRIPPDEAIQFVAENSKPSDLISMGFGTVDEAEESIHLIKKYF
jgi:hypothetical protein